MALVFNLEAEQSRRGDQSQAKLTQRIGIVLEDSHRWWSFVRSGGNKKRNRKGSELGDQVFVKSWP